MKLKIKHYDLAPILKKKALFNIIYGGRYSGKSYAVKDYCLRDFHLHGHQTAYIRRWDKDTTAPLVAQYFADSDIVGPTGGDFDMIDAGKGRIELSQYDIEAQKKHNRTTFGYYFPMNTASRFASTQYPDVRNIIVEEFIPIDGRYVVDELELLFHLFSTIVREHDDECKIFMICNAISRQSPYWEEFDCSELVRRQEIGDIDVIERDTKAGKQRIAIEYARPSEKPNKIFAGKRETMTVEGKWLADPHPKIDDLSLWTRIHVFYIEYLQARFQCSYLVRGDEYTIYVEPFEKEFPRNARVISDKFSFRPMTTNNLKPLTDAERLILDALPSKCCYSDDLTGTEFEEILQFFTETY